MSLVPTARPRERWAALARWLRLAVSLALFAWILSTVDLRQVLRLVSNARGLPLLGAAAVIVLDRILMFAKWLPLLRIQAPEIGIWHAARVYMASSFASLFMPSMAADLLRGVALGRGRKAIPEIGASIFLERILGMLGGAVLSVVSIWIALHSAIDRSTVIVWGAIATLVPPVIVTLSLATMKLERMGAWIETRRIPGAGLIRRFGSAYSVYRSHPKTVLGVWLASILEQALPIAFYALMARSMSSVIEPKMLWLAVPLMLFAARLPVTLAGLGVAEAGGIYLLGLFGVPASDVLALMLVGRTVELIVLLPGGLVVGDLTKKTADERPKTLS